MFCVYVAGRSRDEEMERAALVMDMLRSRRVRVLSSWVEAIRGKGKANEGLDRAAQVVAQRRCRLEVRASDALLILVPPGGDGLGQYVEYGLAMAAGKILVVSDAKSDRSVFWSGADLVVPTDEEAVEFLAAMVWPG